MEERRPLLLLLLYRETFNPFLPQFKNKTSTNKNFTLVFFFPDEEDMPCNQLRERERAVSGETFSRHTTFSPYFSTIFQILFSFFSKSNTTPVFCKKEKENRKECQTVKVRERTKERKKVRERGGKKVRERRESEWKNGKWKEKKQKLIYKFKNLEDLTAMK